MAELVSVVVVAAVAKAREGFEVEHVREVVEVKHLVRLTVFAEECGVVAEPQILHEEGNVAAVAALDALAELRAEFVGIGSDLVFHGPQ